MLEAAVGSPLPAGAQPDRSALSVDAPAAGAGPAQGSGARGAQTTANAAADANADASVESLERQRDAAAATARMYESQHAPTIAAQAQVGVRAQNPIAGGGASAVFPVYRIGVSVNVPLFDGGGAQASAAAARAQAEELAARSREAEQARQTARQRAEADAAAAQERLRLARELLALSDTRVQDAEARYEEARGPIEAIAEANAMRRRANTEIVMAEVAAARARYTLQDQQ
jgi:outer membrane protein TolC